MVITFNSRFQDIKNRCAPLLGKRRIDMPSDITSKGKSGAAAGGMPRTRDSDETINRHKRQKQELAYTVATIEEALLEAGRPTMSLKSVRRERALPYGSVDLSLSKVVSASEYDASSHASAAAEDTDKSKDREQDIYCKAFYSNYSSLIQSTRHYYNVSSSSDSKFANDENEKKSESSSSMEGLSSWTPTSSNHDMNDNKDIDNDNRSDQSSLNDGGSTSDSDESISSQNVTSANKDANESSAAFSVVG
jgi:hypothetical protein